MRLLGLAVLIGLGCAAPALPPDIPGGPSGLDSLPGLRTRVTLTLEAPLAGWIDALQKHTGVPIRVDPRVEEFRPIGEPVRLHLQNMSAGAALKWVLRDFACDCVVQDGVVIVRAPETAGTVSTVLHTYPVRTVPREFFTPLPPRIELGEGSQILVVTPPPRPANGETDTQGIPEIETLCDLVKESVAPGTWEGVQTIEHDGQGNFVVNAPIKIQQNVQALLDALRDTFPPTITVAVTLADAEGNTPLRTIPADRIDETLRALRKNRPLEIEVAGPERDFAPAVLRRGTTEAAHLFARAAVVDDGRSLRVDLRLSAGRSGQVTRLATSVLVPNGGGVLFTLPSIDSKPQLCLVRAGCTEPGPARPLPIRFLPDPSSDPNIAEQRLADAPAAPLDLDRATLDDFAAWLRKTTGLTVFLPRSPGKQRLTIHAEAIRPLDALTQLLRPLNLRFRARDEAIQINDSSLIKESLRMALFDSREIASPMPEFDRGELATYFTDEDLANLLKNSVRKDQWEEADGKSLMIHRGFLFIRNSSGVLRDCADFIEGRRRLVAARVAFRAETIDLPVEELGGAGAGLLVDAAQRDRLLAAGRRVEHLEWAAFQGQKSWLEWNRTRDASSFIEACAVLREDGRTFDVGVDVHDEARPDTPALSTATRVQIPVGRTSIFRVAAGGRARILLLTPSLLR